ncbi:hypothetical protein PR202_gb27003 [Eleusine coracana subsp. coracana]|uniref:Uncharacterized protein n=1 Tax=Eleusine coracana subsp. coracana TaxID=191504 RepID=A0AAV5FSM1_ELECO|nr:hypothetical protein PR202_gb27003 [Eleusine coracana subsp. coracana]
MALPRRRSLPFPPIFLLLPVPLILLFLLHRSFHSTAPLLPTARSSFDLAPDRFSLLIKLLAYDRPAALRRCLRSLAAADYEGDRVALHVLLDHRPPNASSAGDTSGLAPSHEMLAFVNAFPWPHGEKRVHYRAANVGLQAQWIEAWWPGSDNEFAFVVEDDLEVSPLYYSFLKRVVMRYYYDRENYSPYVFGASLQRPRFVAGESLFNAADILFPLLALGYIGKHGNKIQLDSETRIFLYQMVGTWGQLLFPKPWKEFRLWYDEHKAKGIKPILQGMPLKKLKWYDFCFNEVLPGRIVRKFDEVGSVLKSVQVKNTVILLRNQMHLVLITAGHWPRVTIGSSASAMSYMLSICGHDFPAMYHVDSNGPTIILAVADINSMEAETEKQDGIKMGERIWTPWFIKFVHARGYFNIYTNFLKERALSVSHRDAGVNYGRSVGPDSTLLDGKNLDFNIWDLQPLKKLKWYDFCFNEVLPGRIVRKF